MEKKALEMYTDALRHITQRRDEGARVKLETECMVAATSLLASSTEVVVELFNLLRSGGITSREAFLAWRDADVKDEDKTKEKQKVLTKVSMWLSDLQNEVDGDEAGGEEQ